MRAYPEIIILFAENPPPPPPTLSWRSMAQLKKFSRSLDPLPLFDQRMQRMSKLPIL